MYDLDVVNVRLLAVIWGAPARREIVSLPPPRPIPDIVSISYRAPDPEGRFVSLHPPRLHFSTKPILASATTLR